MCHSAEAPNSVTVNVNPPLLNPPSLHNYCVGCVIYQHGCGGYWTDNSPECPKLSDTLIKVEQPDD